MFGEGREEGVMGFIGLSVVGVGLLALVAALVVVVLRFDGMD